MSHLESPHATVIHQSTRQKCGGKGHSHHHLKNEGNEFPMYHLMWKKIQKILQDRVANEFKEWEN